MQRFDKVYKGFALIATAIFFLVSGAILSGCQTRSNTEGTVREAREIYYGCIREAPLQPPQVIEAFCSWKAWKITGVEIYDPRRAERDVPPLERRAKDRNKNKGLRV